MCYRYIRNSAVEISVAAAGQELESQVSHHHHGPGKYFFHSFILIFTVLMYVLVATSAHSTQRPPQCVKRLKTTTEMAVAHHHHGLVASRALGILYIYYTNSILGYVYVYKAMMDG